MQIKAVGKWKIEDDQISIITNSDFCKYYAWLYKKATWNTQKVNLPAHGAHFNVVNPKIHGKIDCAKFKYLNGKEVYFYYSISGNFGGFTKGFVNFWLNVNCKKAEFIAKKLGVYKKEESFSVFHITIFNTKNL